MFSKQVIVLVNISYWMPDYSNIIQEFTWQTGDISPTYPKVHNFLYPMKIRFQMPLSLYQRMPVFQYLSL